MKLVLDRPQLGVRLTVGRLFVEAVARSAFYPWWWVALFRPSLTFEWRPGFVGWGWGRSWNRWQHQTARWVSQPENIRGIG